MVLSWSSLVNHRCWLLLKTLSTDDFVLPVCSRVNATHIRDPCWLSYGVRLSSSRFVSSTRWCCLACCLSHCWWVLCLSCTSVSSSRSTRRSWKETCRSVVVLQDFMTKARDRKRKARYDKLAKEKEICGQQWGCGVQKFTGQYINRRLGKMFSTEMYWKSTLVK